ncbi:hypothetical protein [Serratia liquefaciens]|uniref:hypothetical protein n=1 Tax=Serratia liquefaciens TaxID=614 RepID=UPI0010204981|nr:hypothetical protein [Serratia liquefaciens]RYM69597.1 hypothetical protein BSQ99_17590 [Serratia liquefaciens]
MTQTLTTEQLKNLSYSGGIVGDLARELLANREAQPVGFISAKHGPVLYDEHIGLPAGTHFYTAPPAPAVNASQDFEAWFVEKYKQPERLIKNEDGTYKFSGVQMAFSGWSDGRAAMLAQPVGQGCKLVPVPTVKKFIPVSSVSSTVNGTEPFPAALTCEEAAALDGTIFLSHLKPGGMVQVYAAVGKDDDRELIAFNPKDFKFTAPEGGNEK